MDKVEYKKCDWCNKEFPKKELEELKYGYICVSCKVYVTELLKRINCELGRI